MEPVPRREAILRGHNNQDPRLAGDNSAKHTSSLETKPVKIPDPLATQGTEADLGSDLGMLM